MTGVAVVRRRATGGGGTGRLGLLRVTGAATGGSTGTTGRTGATLKVRPPLVWQDEHVELFVTAFDEALGVGLGAGL